MNIVDMRFEEYLKLLSSKSSSPGGGSVAGVSLAQGIALNLMVINLTLNNAKYREYFDFNEDMKKENELLFNDAIKLIDEDRKALENLIGAYKMKNETDEEKKLKKATLNEASLYATKVPLNIMETCLNAIELTKLLIEKTTKLAISDLGVSASMLKSSAESAWLNVKINLPYLENKEIGDKFQENALKILDIVNQEYEYIYSKVEKSI